MRKLLIATAAFALLGAPAAFAQQDDHHDHRGEGQGSQNHGSQGSQGSQGQHSQGPQSQGPQSSGPQSSGPQSQGHFQGPPNQGPQNQSHFQGPVNEGRYQGSQSQGGRPEAYSEHRYYGGQQGQQGPQGQPGHYYQQGQGQYRQGEGQFRQGDRADHRDWGRFQRNTFAQHRFRFGGYERPQGFYYRRWGYGEFLPRLFWSQNYWLNDYGYFGLPYPPAGCIWVRYGDDALLIDRYTGEIVSVEYSLFY